MTTRRPVLMIESTNPDYGPVPIEEVFFDWYVVARERAEFCRARLANAETWCAANGIPPADVPVYVAWLKRDLARNLEFMEHYERDFPQPAPWVPNFGNKKPI